MTGFPWNLIAYSFSNQLELISITSIFGTYGFNLFCISLFTCPAIFILRKSKKDIVVAIFFLITVLFIYIYGSFYKGKFNNSLKEDYDYKIRVVGSKVSLDRFYLDVDTVSIIQDLIDLSKPIKNDKTIFIWPEGILSNISQEELINHQQLFQKNFSKNHLFIIGINSYSKDDSSENFFNSLSLYDDNLNLLHSYNKINLVPFGEFLPLETILKKIGLRSITNNYQSFSHGNERKVIEIKRENFSLNILPLICYEIIYSGKIFNNSNFDLIVNISED